MRFDESYEEQVELRDGTRALLRCVRPEDKVLLRRGFDELSPESRYMRFFSAKKRLSDAELSYLTEVDGSNHFAIGVGNLEGTEGLAIGRFVRDERNATVAEPAIAVVDHAHGNGIGTLLLHRLVDAALERGIETFHCVVLADNEPMKALLEELSPDIHYDYEGEGVCDALMPLHASREPRRPMQRLLAHVARQAVHVPLGHRLRSWLEREPPGP